MKEAIKGVAQERMQGLLVLQIIGIIARISDMLLKRFLRGRSKCQYFEGE